MRMTLWSEQRRGERCGLSRKVLLKAEDLAKDSMYVGKVLRAQGALELSIHSHAGKGRPGGGAAEGPVGVAMSIKGHAPLMKTIPGKSRLKVSVCLSLLK